MSKIHSTPNDTSTVDSTTLSGNRTDVRCDEFRAGTIANYLHVWGALTSDTSILSCVSGYKIPFIDAPVQSKVAKCLIEGSEREVADSEIKALCKKVVLELSSHEDGQFISNFFLRPKKQAGKLRLICNLKELNRFVEYKHFKMETINTVKDTITEGCFMAAIDLNEAYHSVPIDKSHRQYLKIMWKGQLYEYCALAFRLSTAPRVFTKLLKPILARLRWEGHQSVAYLDNWYLQGTTHENVPKTSIARARS